MNTLKRICGCGCGGLVPPHYDKNGRHRGYRKLIKGHVKQKTLAQLNTWASNRQKRIKPIGSRRMVEPTPGLKYWQIKTHDRGRWPLEHRYLMAQKIGRSLQSNEHVHHKDDDGLNNRLSNLVLLSDVEHGRITGKALVQAQKGIHAVPICVCCGWRHPPHK
jgi:hypothetical protein